MTGSAHARTHIHTHTHMHTHAHTHTRTDKHTHSNYAQIYSLWMNNVKHVQKISKPDLKSCVLRALLNEGEDSDCRSP